MSSLLTIGTRPGANPAMGVVRVLCDGVLIDRVSDYTQVFAFSVAGPEEAIRCVHGGCCSVNKDGKHGCVLDIFGAGIVIRGATWAGDWDCRVTRLKDGPTHMVAWANQLKVLGQKDKRHAVIYPASASTQDRDTALYATLLSRYTTPLIPTGVTGQPADEGEVGRAWQKTLCNAIAGNTNWWVPLRPHPQAANMGLTDFWPGAAVLKIEQKELDELVSRLVKQRFLKIPAEAGRELAAVAS